MRSVRKLAAAAIALAVLTNVAGAQTATQTVTFQVSAINQITVSGNPAALIVAAAPAGGSPTSVTNSATTYSLTTNESNKIITAVITGLAMPTGVTLQVALAAPGSGTSTGATTLTTTAANVVTGIGPTNGSGGITYTLSATAAAGTVASQTRTITFTVMTGP